ncbi:MAG TPA: phosphoribosyl-AMP cyclohydrolase, partial [Roseomonas sp.]
MATPPNRPAGLPAWHPPSPEARARFLAALKPDPNGLVAAIAQAHDSGEVLMLAWMNAEAVEETLATGRVTYYSRSRKALWRKGETSGQVQH